MTDKKNKKDNC